MNGLQGTRYYGAYSGITQAKSAAFTSTYYDNYDLTTEAERDELLVIKMDLSSLLRVRKIIRNIHSVLC